MLALQSKISPRMNDIGSLIAKIKNPDDCLAEQEEAFAMLVRLFQDRAYACAYAILGDWHLAEDAAQAAFISAWQKLSQLRDPAAFSGWFRRLVVTECHRIIRRQRVLTVPLDEANEAEPAPANSAAPASAKDAQQILEETELAKSVLRAVQRLTESQRLVVMLFYLDQQTQPEIARFLGVPLTTVAKRLYTARERLRGELVNVLQQNFAAHRPSRNQTFAEKVRAGIYDEYVGQYRFDQRPDLLVTIRREGDKLFGEGGGQTNCLAANRNADHELVTKEFDGRGRFVRGRGGRVSHLIYYEFGKEMGRARKIG